MVLLKTIQIPKSPKLDATEPQNDRVQTKRVNSIFSAIPLLTKDLDKIKSGEPINFDQFSARVIPIGFKLAASHIEKDIDFALESGADYIILDGRGGGTGAAPLILRDNINVPTIPALARARRHLKQAGQEHVTLVITGGLRTPADFVKALMLGADAIAVANSALQAIGCLGMRACHTNNCPVGIATQKDSLRKRLVIEKSAEQLSNFLNASNELIKVVSRACGYGNISEFNRNDLTTFNRDLHHLAGIHYGGTFT